MTDQQPHERGPNRRGGPGNSGAWQPVPGGGDYDPDQTMHVSFAAQLPPEPRPGEDPLGAHGPVGGWSGHQDEEGGYQVGMPLYGPQDGAAYDYRPAGPERSDGREGSDGSYDRGGYGQQAAPADGGPGFTPGGRGGAAADQDPATAWSIPVIREETEADSGEYPVGSFAPSWDQAPSPAAPPSFPAAMFGQGAAAAQAAAQARAAEPQAGPGAAERSGPAPLPEHGTGRWAMPFTGPEGGDAVPWLPAHAPAADAAWSDVVDDPEAPSPAAGPAVPPAQGAADDERPGGHGDAAGGFTARPVHEAADTADTADTADHADNPASADFAGFTELTDVSAAHAPETAGPSVSGESAAPAAPDRPDAEADPAEDGGPAQSDDAPPPAVPAEADADAASDAQDGAAGTADPAGYTKEPLPEAEPAPEAAAEPAEPAEPVGETRSEHPLASYMLRVNGTDRPVTDAWLGESLLYVLRERLGLAGAKDGCEQGECGACSVQVDGRLVASCLVPAATAAGSEVRTVEGLTVDGRASDVQRALAESGAVQCGFCIPGMAMTVHDLLEGNHKPTDLDVRQALSGNLCRCSGYRGVLDAVRQVVADRDTDDPPMGGPAPEDLTRVPHQGGPAIPGGAQ